MGLLFICKSWNSPSEVWLQRMIELLEPHIAVIVTSQSGETMWGDRVPVAPIAVPRVSMRHRVAWSVGLGRPARVAREDSLARLRALVDSPDVDSVLIHYLTLAIESEPVWQATTKPVFVHCHGYDVTWDMKSPKWPHRRVHRSAYPSAVRRLADRAMLIANSEATAGKLTGIGVPADRIEVKYFGVPVPDSIPDRSTASQDLSLLYLGRLVDFKGPDYLIRAFDLACRKGLSGRLVMAGDGPMRGTCEKLRRRSLYRDRIEMLGAVDRATARRLRASADIFTTHNLRGPTTRQEEAFGVAFVEAMAQGLPVVSGRSGSLPELIEDQVEGILVEPGDVGDHADALARLAASPELRRRFGEAAWRKAKARFSQDQERTRLIEILGLNDAPRSRDPD